MLVFVLNQAQKANTGKIQTPVYENVREFGIHSLTLFWQIEESFRISKSRSKARPCFHRKERQIRGHFLVCFMALVMHRLLEKELGKAGPNLSAERITEAIS